ncbi:MAG: adenosylcobinamide-GDP ribazoletransferase [Nitrospinaceae bacterium]|nr:MAG: adenosylcobinamide-GDP ribazoletransferase [Nitrospinaceae bacterium]
MVNFVSALGFLTIIPMPAKAFRVDGRQIIYFPMVGLLIGGLLFGVDKLGALYATQEIRVVADIMFLAIISGALHLDGLADSADGLFSHRPKEKILEIMQDSRIGVMGALAVFFCLTLKMAGLSGLTGPGYEIWLFIAPALARTSQVIGLVFMDYARREGGKSQIFFQRKKYQLLALGIIPIALPFWIAIETGILVLLLFLSGTALMLWFFQKAIGGITGDTLGALTEVMECVLFLTGALILKHG